ncbi:MAG: endolytic transglycosylase MltG [Dichotomicrobium sp.]
MSTGSNDWDSDERFASDSYVGARNDFSVLPRSPAEALEPDQPPEAPRGRKPKRQRQRPVFALMNAFFTALFLGLIGLVGAFYYAKMQFDSPGPLKHNTVVTIPSGEGVNAIASRLEREGIIHDRRIFMAAVLYFGAQAKLKAGDYAVESRAPMRSVLDTLIEGDAILYKVTVPEGWTSQQVVERLRAHEELTGEIEEVPPEGSLLPETYRFARNTPRSDIISRMQEAQDEFLSKIWPSRDPDLPFDTKEEALILASIVEKETGLADERSKVAGVFINRLRQDMRLASDPTIIYGLVGGKGALDRPITRSEITKETPYNTYVIKGLPPTPIANPGRSAIEAVLRPAETDALYFVADGSGGHAFAETLSEHNRNVAEWRKIEREMREQQAAEEAEQETEQQTAEAEEQPSSETAAMAAMADEAASADDAASESEPPPVPLPQRAPR